MFPSGIYPHVQTSLIQEESSWKFQFEIQNNVHYAGTNTVIQ